MDPYSNRLDEPARRRRRTTTLELEILEIEFAKCDKPSISERERISERISTTDIGGPGMNSREIQVWFQNKRQAIRRAQGAYPNCESMSDRAKARLANEQLFGIKLGPARSDQTTPPQSFSSLDDSSSSVQAGDVATHHGLPTPNSSLFQERRAQLVLSDLGDGHAEIMFSPTPLKPSSPPRIPALITPIKTPLSRKIAARSASSPALFSTGARLFSQGTVLKDTTNLVPRSATTTPIAAHNSTDLGILRSLKRPHSFMSSNKKAPDSVLSAKRTQSGSVSAKKSSSFHELGRGKENIPPIAPSFSVPRTPLPNPSPVRPSSTNTGSKDETSYGRDIRRIHSENLAQAWNAKSTASLTGTITAASQSPESNNSVPKFQIHASPQASTKDVRAAEPLPARKKLSAEECALSLVSLAHGV